MGQALSEQEALFRFPVLFLFLAKHFSPEGFFLLVQSVFSAKDHPVDRSGK